MLKVFFHYLFYLLAISANLVTLQQKVLMVGILPGVPLRSVWLYQHRRKSRVTDMLYPRYIEMKKR